MIKAGDAVRIVETEDGSDWRFVGCIGVVDVVSEGRIRVRIQQPGLPSIWAKKITKRDGKEEKE